MFFVALGSAVVAIRRRDVAHHREWMIRAFAIGLGIATMRIIAMPILFLIGDLRAAALVTFWSGWLLTLGAAELWIRRTRPGGKLSSVATAAPSFSTRVGA